MYRLLYHPGVWSLPASVGIAILRVSAGLMMAIGHGWPLIERLSDQPVEFPDPLGLGAEISLAATVATEFLCALSVAIGFLTRWTSAPVVFTMIVAAFVVEAGSPWEWKEHAVLFACAFLTLAWTGPGRFSIDAYLFETARWEDQPQRGTKKRAPSKKTASSAKTTTRSPRKTPAKTGPSTAKKTAKKATRKRAQAKDPESNPSPGTRKES